MSNTLYLMVGLPGAGKTVAAIAIANVTGASHIWADEHRKQKFEKPLFSDDENEKLYHNLNNQAELLLQAGKNVVYDTAFNHYSDREKLRVIATKYGANTVVVWVQTPEEMAKIRATSDAELQDTRLLGDMSQEHFENLKNKLEQPKDSEKTVILDGTMITDNYVKAQLEKAK